MASHFRTDHKEKPFIAAYVSLSANSRTLASSEVEWLRLAARRRVCAFVRRSARLDIAEKEQVAVHSSVCDHVVPNVIVRPSQPDACSLPSKVRRHGMDSVVSARTVAIDLDDEVALDDVEALAAILGHDARAAQSRRECCLPPGRSGCCGW